MHTHARARTRAHTHVRTHTHTHTHTRNTYTHAHTYIHIHTHTQHNHTHTNTQKHPTHIHHSFDTSACHPFSYVSLSISFHTLHTYMLPLVWRGPKKYLCILWLMLPGITRRYRMGCLQPGLPCRWATQNCKFICVSVYLSTKGWVIFIFLRTRILNAYLVSTTIICSYLR